MHVRSEYAFSPDICAAGEGGQREEGGGGSREYSDGVVPSEYSLLPSGVGNKEEEGREEGEEVGSTPSSLLSLVRIYAQPVRSQLTAR